MTKRNIFVAFAVFSAAFCSCSRTLLERSAEFVPIAGATVRTSIGDSDGPFGAASQSSPIQVASFRIAKTELTYAQWKEVYDWATSHGYKFENAGRQGSDGVDGAVPTDTQPVAMISWRDAVVWCNAASERAGLTPAYTKNNDGSTVVRDSTNDDADSVGDGVHTNGYRLPTEKEWEFAARGGNPNNATNWNYTYAGSDDIDAVAWYKGNSNYTHNVGKKQANGAGLYDMSGNVSEWCYDRYRGLVIGHVLRGGSWFDAPPSEEDYEGWWDWYTPPDRCAVADRDYDALRFDLIGNECGFRVVRSGN